MPADSPGDLPAAPSNILPSALRGEGRTPHTEETRLASSHAPGSHGARASSPGSRPASRGLSQYKNFKVAERSAEQVHALKIAVPALIRNRHK